jgi:16S rRNA (uracil1498-N3)-methyltransferase
VGDQPVAGDRVRVTGDSAHYLLHVLRLGPGGRFSAVMADGVERIAEVREVGDGWAEALLLEPVCRGADPVSVVRLRPALIRAPKLELVIQKTVELGVAEITPVLCARSVARPDQARAARKPERWQRIADEAARQCGRTVAPQVGQVVPFAEAVREAAGTGDRTLILSPEAPSTPRPWLTGDGCGRAVTLFVGPEGGFTVEEVGAAVAVGAQPLALGRRTLRAETAAIVACALVMEELGELA